MAKPKGGLGKGLGALIPVTTTGSQPTTEVDIDLILPNPRQPRQVFESTALEELAESVREHGVIQPLVVTEAEGPSSGARIFQIIAGERRWRAAKLAGLSTIPVVVKEVSPEQVLEIALVENIQRADLSPLEEAAAYRQLIEEFHLTQEQVASRVGKSRPAVTNILRLLNLPENVKAALASGAISEGHARAILALSDPRQQTLALELTVQRSLSVRQTEITVQQLSANPEITTTGKSSEGPLPPDPDTLALEDRFRMALGAKVQIFRNRNKGGKIVIQFYSEEELQGIYDTIVRD